MIGKKKIVDTSKNYKEKLKEVVNNPLCTGKIYLIKEELRKNLLVERKNNLLEKWILIVFIYKIKIKELLSKYIKYFWFLLNF